ncbi:retron system putative HNH endonuclease [Thermodesulfobacteriota bacterium]
MKYIRKGQEPQSLKDWKDLENEDWKPAYRDLTDPQKRDLRDSLFREQGYICCYCMTRIKDRRSTHIEHLRPQRWYSDLQLDYQNLLASCRAGEGEDRQGSSSPDEAGSGASDQCREEAHASSTSEPESRSSAEHCGFKKGDWYDDSLMVSPLNDSCEEFFTYGAATGKIKPVNDPAISPAAEETIRRLGLNSDRLIRLRRQALIDHLPQDEEPSRSEISQLIEGYGQTDANGMFVPFCAAIVNVLCQYLPEGL